MVPVIICYPYPIHGSFQLHTYAAWQKCLLLERTFWWASHLGLQHLCPNPMITGPNRRFRPNLCHSSFLLPVRRIDSYLVQITYHSIPSCWCSHLQLLLISVRAIHIFHTLPAEMFSPSSSDVKGHLWTPSHTGVPRRLVFFDQSESFATIRCFLRCSVILKSLIVQPTGVDNTVDSLL